MSGYKEAQDFEKSELVIKRSDVLKLSEYLQHDSWRCEAYKKCHCGLDELCDELDIERVTNYGVNEK